MKVVAFFLSTGLVIRSLLQWLESGPHSQPEGSLEGVTQAHALLLSKEKSMAIAVHAVNNTHEFLIMGVKTIIFWVVLFIAYKAWRAVRTEDEDT